MDVPPMSLPADLHLVSIQQLLDLSTMQAWRSFALRQQVSDSIGLLLRQGDEQRRRRRWHAPRRAGRFS